VTTLNRWRKSSRSNDTATCVEVRNTLDAVRDSKDPSGTVLVVGNLSALLREVKAGRYDLS
jgi:hypothetical protein